jgi:acyl carrier protein
VTTEALRDVVIGALRRIAPEIDPASIDAVGNLRDQFDLDSMDFLNFVVALHERLGIDIPESDYPRMYTLDSAVAYVASRVGEPQPSTGSAAHRAEA